MAEENSAPVATESAPETAMSFEASAQAALAEYEKSHPESDQQEAAAPEGQAETTPVPTPAEEPEHVKWAKSVSGNTDGEGNIIQDRVLKQAYELNRQNQQTARELAQLNLALRHPEVAQAIQRVIAGTPAKPEPVAERADKTDEQILAEFVEDKIASKIKPVVESNEALVSRLVLNDCNSTYEKLTKEFGKENFDAVLPAINQQLNAVAQQTGISFPELTKRLVLTERLSEVYSNAAKSMLYEKFKQDRAQEAQTKQASTVEAKKKLTAVPVQSSTGKTLSKPAREIKDFWDAAKLAEEQEAARAKP